MYGNMYRHVIIDNVNVYSVACYILYRGDMTNQVEDIRNAAVNDEYNEITKAVAESAIQDAAMREWTKFSSQISPSQANLIIYPVDSAGSPVGVLYDSGGSLLWEGSDDSGEDSKERKNAAREFMLMLLRKRVMRSRDGDDLHSIMTLYNTYEQHNASDSARLHDLNMMRLASFISKKYTLRAGAVSSRHLHIAFH